MNKKRNKNKNIKPNTEHLRKLKEWQRHQYDPGHYTGGNIFPFLLHSERRGLLGWFFIITSIISVLLITIFLYFTKGEITSQPGGLLIGFIVIFSAIGLYFTVGLRMLLKGRTINRKKILTALTISLIVVLVGTAMYRVNYNYDTITVVSRGEVELHQKLNRNYVYIKEKNTTLSSSLDDYLSFIWILGMGNKDNVKFEILYRWNNFTPKRGKIIEIIEK